MIRFIMFCMLAQLVAFPCYAKGSIRTVEGVVTKVTDGDSILVTATNGKKMNIRLYGVDAPEVGKPEQPYGKNAQRALEEMVANKHVRLEIMAVNKGKSTVAIVWTVENIVNKEMLKHGWAWAYRKELESSYASEYIDLEDQARKERRGLWEESNPQPPWEFSKQQKKGKTR